MLLCTQNSTPLTKHELSMHNDIKRCLGQIPPRSYVDEDGYRVVEDRFVDSFTEKCDFSMHLPFSVNASTVPRMKHVPDLLWKIRNIVLSRAIFVAEACSKRQEYLQRFVKNPSIDGTISRFSQAYDFFMEEYSKIDTKYKSLLAEFEQVNTKESYLSFLNNILDWRYTNENRCPSNAPWQCWPKAQIHEDDVGIFE